MIELLLTISLVAVLGTIATTTFIDFRGEARYADISNKLMAMRTGIALQKKNTLFKCNATMDNNLINWWAVLFNNMVSHDGFNPGVNCPISEFPTAQSRKIYDVPRIPSYSFGIPANPFVVNRLTPSFGFGQAEIDAYGGVCGTANYVMTLVGGPRVDWFFNLDTGEIHPATNTPNFQECGI